MGIWWGVSEKIQCVQDNTSLQYYGDYKNISYNHTPIEDMDKDTKSKYLTDNLGSLKKIRDGLSVISVSIFLFTFGTTGNVIIIIIITCNKDMRTVPNMYILNLAISDIIYLTLLFLEEFALRTSVTWLDGEIGCAFFEFCYRTSVDLTAYSIAVLSIQRYRVTVNPLHVRVSSQLTWRDTGATICGMWVVAALFTIPAVRSK
jgi:hypothetical protein